MIDGDEENRHRALAYFKDGDIETQIIYHVGDAVRIARTLKGVYDIILNDIDKHEYPATIDVAADLLRPGGLFITDNILWSGRVLDTRQRDPNTRGVRAFTKKLYADQRFFTTILPVRDGITVALRTADE
jgi:predicted O-methyltransferase YrrM